MSSASPANEPTELCPWMELRPTRASIGGDGVRDHRHMRSLPGTSRQEERLPGGGPLAMDGAPSQTHTVMCKDAGG